jgi:hypothetical protein
MAVFRSLQIKSKTYVFDYADNKKLKEPARAVFSRFPSQDEYFLKSGKDTRYSDVDFSKVGKKDTKEVEKLFAAFITSYLTESVNGVSGAFSRVDIEAFLRECVDHFENLYTEREGEAKTKREGKAMREIKTVDDFLGLPSEAVYDIARDLYIYARNRDKFTLGE